MPGPAVTRHLYESPRLCSGALKCVIIAVSVQLSTFESIYFTVKGYENTIAVLLIYSGSSSATDSFVEELASHLEVTALCKCQIVVTGDFNIRVESVSDAHSK